MYSFMDTEKKNAVFFTGNRNFFTYILTSFLRLTKKKQKTKKQKNKKKNKTKHKIKEI